MKKLFIDNRMREIEKNKLVNLGYELIEIPENKRLYQEISSHVDIHICKIKDKIILEKTFYDYMNNAEYIKGTSIVYEKYPEDIKYNACIVGNKAIHNFKYTDSMILKILEENNFEIINVNQGYTKCSIAIIDENSIITSDVGLYNTLRNTGLDILFLDYSPNIKLLNNNKYSDKKGFIGGAISRIDDNIFISGDLSFIDKENKIRDFITKKELNIIDFKQLDVIDYGGIIYGNTRPV